MKNQNERDAEDRKAACDFAKLARGHQEIDEDYRQWLEREGCSPVDPARIECFIGGVASERKRAERLVEALNKVGCQADWCGTGGECVRCEALGKYEGGEDEEPK